MTTPARARILQHGAVSTVYALEAADGACPARDFLGGLDANGQTGFKSRLETLAAQGYLRSPEFMRELNVPGRPKIFEIKVDKGPGLRLYVVRQGRDWLATHGGSKPRGNAGVRREVELARRVYEEWSQ